MLFCKIVCAFLIVGIADQIHSRQFAAHTRRKCIPELTVAWSRELSSGPFVSAPLVADIDTDSVLDVAITSFTGDVHVVRSTDGQYRRGSHWPLRLLHDTIYTTPIQYDVDRDGILDLIICTAAGQLMFIHSNGSIMNVSKLDRVSVQRDWHKQQVSASQQNIHDFILDNESEAAQGVRYVHLDPHVLSTPVVEDINQDGQTEELLLSVSYYLDPDDYSLSDGLPDGLTVNDTSNYLVSALVYYNITTGQTYLTVHLDLTKKSAEYPAYLLAPATVIDVDVKRVGLETLIGTSAGRLHLIDLQGHTVAPYPVPLGVITTQVVVDDINGDGDLEVIVQEVGGNVACFNVLSGQRLWETETSGTSPIAARLADITGDTHLETVVATDDGQVWVLNSTTGAVVYGWPVKIASQLHAAPLFTKLHNLDLTLIVNLGSDGMLHILSTDGSCQSHVSVGESSLVNIVSHDLLPTVPGVELLIATADGTLLCLTSHNVSSEVGVDRHDIRAVSWPSELRSHNDFTYTTQRFVAIDNYALTEFTDYTFTLDFTIVDNIKPHSVPYTCQVLMGGIVLETVTLFTVGSHSVIVNSPRHPVTGHLTLHCHNKHSVLLHDVIIVRFYSTFLSDLQWLFAVPCLCLSVLVLFLHGFPTADILPVTVLAKHR